MQLRPYQIDAIERTRVMMQAGMRRVIIQASTGAGKTVIASDIIRRAVDKNASVLFLAHARELVQQCSRKLEAFGIDHGIIMAGCARHSANVQVASKDTILARAVRDSRMELPPADMLIVDECHRSLSKWYRHLIEMYENAYLIGLTATPARSTGLGLGDFYHGMIQVIPSSQLIEQGFLVPTRVFAPYRPNLKGVRVEKGDYNKTQLEERMNKPKLVGDIVQHWKDLGEDRQTVVFASGVSHSMHLCEEFKSAGVTCEHLDANTPTDEREGILKRLADGDTRIVCNVGVLTEGWDCPVVSCVVLARPSKSFVLFRQMAGRVQRPWPGKTDAILIDHSGAVYVHGFPDADIEWELKSTEKIQDVVKERIKSGKMQEPVCCPRCHAMYSGRPTCPVCGYVPRQQPQAKEDKGGKLVALERGVGGVENPVEYYQRIWHKCLAIAANRNGSGKMAVGIFKSETGGWPQSFLRNYIDFPDREKKVAELFPQYVRKAKV